VTGPDASGSPPPARRRSRAGAWIRAGVTLVLLLLLVRVVDLREVGQVLAGADLRILAAAALVLALDRVLQIGKWVPLLRVLVPSIPVVRAARAYFASYAVSFLLPASVGGDVLRAVALGRGRRAIAEVGASIVIERLLGLLAIVALAVVAVLAAMAATVPLAFILPWALVSLAGLVAAFLLPLVPAVSRRLASWSERVPAGAGGFLRRFLAAYARYRAHPRLLAVVALLSVVETGYIIAIFWLVALALHTSITFPMMLVVTPVMIFLYRIPVTYWGLGVVELGVVELFGLYGVPAAEAISVTLAWRAVEFAVALPGIALWADLVRSPEVRDAPAGGSASGGAAGARAPAHARPAVEAAKDAVAAGGRTEA
jgi:uncharacterized protein (TIRG00374 family)